MNPTESGEGDRPHANEGYGGPIASHHWRTVGTKSNQLSNQNFVLAHCYEIQVIVSQSNSLEGELDTVSLCLLGYSICRPEHSHLGPRKCLHSWVRPPEPKPQCMSWWGNPPSPMVSSWWVTNLLHQITADALQNLWSMIWTSDRSRLQEESGEVMRP